MGGEKEDKSPQNTFHGPSPVGGEFDGSGEEGGKVRLRTHEKGEKEIVVTPGTATDAGSTTAPSDAIILFDGKNLDQWQKPNGEAPEWIVKDGVFTVKPGTGSSSSLLCETKPSFR